MVLISKFFFFFSTVYFFDFMISIFKCSIVNLFKFISFLFYLPSNFFKVRSFFSVLQESVLFVVFESFRFFFFSKFHFHKNKFELNRTKPNKRVNNRDERFAFSPPNNIFDEISNSSENALNKCRRPSPHPKNKSMCKKNTKQTSQQTFNTFIEFYVIFLPFFRLNMFFFSIHFNDWNIYKRRSLYRIVLFVSKCVAQKFYSFLILFDIV